LVENQLLNLSVPGTPEINLSISIGGSTFKVSFLVSVKEAPAVPITLKIDGSLATTIDGAR
jgi:hypothetical protein